MPTIDNDTTIRDRAYLLWERAGRPSGREHEHWAEARRQVEAETLRLVPIDMAEPADVMEIAEPQAGEIVRLRQALYSPEAFSFELFGEECQEIDLPIVIRTAA